MPFDWFRKVIGLPDSSPDREPKENKSWNPYQDNTDRYSGPTYNPDFGFTHMDSLFRHLDDMMRNFEFGDPFGESGQDSEPQNPRDAMLKVPDSEINEDSQNPASRQDPPDQRTFPPPSVPGDWCREDYHDGKPHWFEGSVMIPDPFSMMDELFKSFGDLWSSPFDDHSGLPGMHEMVPPIEDYRSDENLRPKKDSGLDDRSNDKFQGLLKRGPGYSYGNDGDTRGGTSHQQPNVHGGYRSTSVVRIRKPDGSVEETRKYTDSTGREEVTVTHIDPQHGGNPVSPSFPPGGEPGDLLKQPKDGSSVLGWLFRR